MNERSSVLGFWVVSQNITILVILISLVKYFSSVFARGCRLKAEPRNFLCPYMILLSYYFSISL